MLRAGKVTPVQKAAQSDLAALGVRAAWLLPALCAVFATRSILLDPSVAYYRHDWGWPATSVQMQLSFWRNIGFWDSSGLGQPNYEPMLHPVFVLWHIAAGAFPPHVIASATIVICFAVFGFGIAACCRALLGLPPQLSFAIGAAAVFGPPLLNKTAAGHIYYLVALASYPWTVRFALSSRRGPRDALAAAAIAALSAIQIQIFAFSVLTLVIGAMRRDARDTAWRLLSVGGAMTLLMPELFAVLHPDVVAALMPMKTSEAWTYNNSAPWSMAILTIGYAPKYYAHAAAAIASFGVVRAMLWCIVAAGVVAAARFVRTPAIAGVLALWLLSMLLVAGVYGPLAVPLMWSFHRYVWFSVFRELYHFAGIEWALLCVMFGVAIGRLRGRWSIAVPLCAAAVLAVPWIPPHFANQLIAAPIPASAKDAVRREAVTPGDSRFISLPAEWPIGPRYRNYGGGDPLAYAAGNHPSANAYRLSGSLEAAAYYAERGGKKAAHWKAVAGIGSVIARTDVVPKIASRFPPLKHDNRYVRGLTAAREAAPGELSANVPTCMLCAYTSLPVVRSASQSSQGDAFINLRDSSYHSDSDPDLVPAPDRYIPAGAFNVVDPSQGWVALRDWDWLDPRLALFDGGVMTWSNSWLDIPRWNGGTYAKVLLLRGTLCSDAGCVRVPHGRPAWVALPRGARIIRVKGGLAAIASIVRLQHFAPLSNLRDRFEPAKSALTFSWESEAGKGTVPGGTRYVVLKQRFSPSWHLQLSAGRVLRHFRASGYANGWEVSVPDAAQISVSYTRWAIGWRLLLLSVALWGVLTLSAVYVSYRE